MSRPKEHIGMPMIDAHALNQDGLEWMCLKMGAHHWCVYSYIRYPLIGWLDGKETVAPSLGLAQ